MDTHLSRRLRAKQAAPYRTGGPETTTGKSPDGKCMLGSKPQAFFKSAMPETTAGKATNALRINAASSLTLAYIQTAAVSSLDLQKYPN